MKIAVVNEARGGEHRVAMVPSLVGKLTALGYQVAVEPGAGVLAESSDQAYRDAGADVESSAIDDAGLVLSVQPLPQERLIALDPGTTTISFLPVTQMPELVAAARNAEITTFSLEMVPRISRAQSMDALSSQALVAGYRSVMIAAERLRRFLPLNMTAAGTVPPAEVLILGAGVAGLQAIATAKRLGAVVRGYDIRAAAAEEIASMGAKPIDLELETLEGAGGYAREMTEDRAQRQRELLAPYVAAADALITTAAVPGRRAPILVTRRMVERMSQGSVVVDLAAESGGNVEGSVVGREITIGGALVHGASNVPSQMPAPASRLFAQNIVNLVTLMTSDGAFAPDFDDEVVAGCCVTHAGRIRHGPTAERLLEGREGTG
ncbi:MAG: NAD(P) transhydrogenase subunit alpha [Nocardioidaceae bacterium]